jgi:nucleotide-binding universal stress UspA family protein
LKRILVPLDFSDPSLRALTYAKTIAKPFTASLDLLHVVPNPYIGDPSGLYTPLPQMFLDEIERDAQTRLEDVLPPDERKAFGVRSIVKVGDPLFEIVEYARVERINLIVMGTHGRTGFRHLFLGSVAERVVRTAPCPVLTVR